MVEFVEVRVVGYSLDQLEEAKHVKRDVYFRLQEGHKEYERMLKHIVNIDSLMTSPTILVHNLLEQSRINDKCHNQLNEITDTIFILEHNAGLLIPTED